MAGDQDYTTGMAGGAAAGVAAIDVKTAASEAQLLGFQYTASTRHNRREAVQYALAAQGGVQVNVDKLIDDAGKILAWLTADDKPVTD